MVGGAICNGIVDRLEAGCIALSKHFQQIFILLKCRILHKVLEIFVLGLYLMKGRFSHTQILKFRENEMDDFMPKLLHTSVYLANVGAECQIID